MIELRKGSAVVRIAPEVGGGLTRYAWENENRAIEWLRSAAEFAVAERDPTGLSCFPLVPFSNRIRDGHFTFGEHEVHLPPNFPPEPHAIHGHGWLSAWQVTDRVPASATLAYQHPPDAWPWRYRAQQHFSLDESGALELTLTVDNQSDDAMPLGFGFHPFFQRTPEARLSTEAERMWEVDGDAMPTRAVAPPDLDPLDPNAIVLDDSFIGWSGEATVTWPGRGARLRMTTDGPFQCVVIFSPEAQNFFCAEPATNSIDAFNLARQGRQDTGMLEVAAGDAVSGTVRLAPEVDPGSSFFQ